MTTSRTLAVTLASAALALASCYRGPSSADPDLGTIPANGFPYGVIVPPAADLKASGIYAMPADSDQYCCWLARRATFQVQVPAGARTLILRIFLPDVDVFRAQPQAAAVSVDDGPWHHFGPLGVGVHYLRVALAPAPQVRVAQVRVRAAFTFVPARRRINGDRRELSMYLRTVTVR